MSYYSSFYRKLPKSSSPDRHNNNNNNNVTGDALDDGRPPPQPERQAQHDVANMKVCDGVAAAMTLLNSNAEEW